MNPKGLPPFSPAGWSAAALADPYPVYARYRESAPVHRGLSTEGESAVWYVFTAAETEHVLTCRDYGRDATAGEAARPRVAPSLPSANTALHEVVRNWLVFLDPPKHTRLRRILNGEFTPRVVGRLRTRIEEIARGLLATVRDKPVIDLVADFSAPLPLAVIAELLGVPRRHLDWYRAQALELQEASTARVARGAQAHRRADAAAGELRAYFLDHVRRRRRRTGYDDLVALLVAARHDGQELSDDEIAATCVHMLTAGHETTTNLISKSVLALLERPELRTRLENSTRAVRQAIDEFIRFDGPVQMISRWAYRDNELGGEHIRRGDKVVLVLGAANRDPARFGEPDVLDPDREPGRHCGFGMGIHFCLGAALARAEGEIGIAALLTEIPGLCRTADPVVYNQDLVFHGPTTLPLRTTPASRSSRGV
ncbi:cytochrome P450 [Actinopolyspora mortivallis]|uniref:Cytochrome P450 n=1 Tax=Actinopolyspora mortivallis TaxID=33906 RepID=A0A2T0GYR6_ACTMO|nr:cytochrome P450 [Actinopolyspora mortivallis]PRW64256.1 cytochrome P450 [Actinopolyspora mortivallis]